MSVLVFDGRKWLRGSQPATHEDAEIEFQNDGETRCHITFDPVESFGIDYIGLAPGYRIRLPFLKHAKTTCTAFLAKEEALSAAAGLLTARVQRAPVPDPLKTGLLDTDRPLEAVL